MSDRAARTTTSLHAAEPATRTPRPPAGLDVGLPAAPGPEQRLVDDEDRLCYLRRLTAPQRHQAILGMQRTVGNHAVQRLIQATRPAWQPVGAGDQKRDAPATRGRWPTLGSAPPAIRRQPRPAQSPSSGTHTITDPEAVIRGGPTDFKSTGKTFAVGTRVEVVATEVSAKRPKGTFVKLVEPGTGVDLGWTSQANLGAVQFAAAAASFVYVAKVQPRPGFSAALPVMVYVPPKFDGKKADIVLYFHGDAANFSAAKSDNYGSENPAMGMQLPGLAIGADQIVVAPQVNEWRTGATKTHKKSPWHTLHAGDYASIVQTVLVNLQADLKLKTAIPRGSVSIAGHSGGGKALGQAAQDLDKTGGGVRDVTLVDAGYGGGEYGKQVKADGAFAKSFQMVRDWLLEGTPNKVLRVVTKASSPGTDTRHAIENDPGSDDAKNGRIPVLGLQGVRNSIKAKGRDADLQADATEFKTDPQKRTGGTRLIRTIVVSKKDGGTTQGTIFVFLMTDPPRAKGVDTHFGTRNATIGAIVSGQGKGDDFAKP